MPFLHIVKQKSRPTIYFNQINERRTDRRKTLMKSPLSEKEKSYILWTHLACRQALALSSHLSDTVRISCSSTMAFSTAWCGAKPTPESISLFIRSNVTRWGSARVMRTCEGCLLLSLVFIAMGHHSGVFFILNYLVQPAGLLKLLLQTWQLWQFYI